MPMRHLPMLMRLFTSAWAIILLVSLSISSHAAVQLIDRVIAVVNESVITQSELDTRVNEILKRSQASGMRLPPKEVLQEQILDGLINETLQLDSAYRYGVTVSDDEVLDSINQIMAKNQWDEQQLKQQLNRDGTTVDEFKQDVRRQLMMQNISRGLVSSRIKISEQDVDNFLNSADAQFWISPDYRLSHILVALPSSADQKDVAAAEQKAQSIYQRLSAGANFEELAVAESDGPMALQGGDMGWRKSSELPTLFAELAPQLEEGQITAPTRSRAGFHILKLNAKRGETKQLVNQTKVRHILLTTSAILDDEQARVKLKALKKAVQEGGDFAELAKQHSADIASKLQGGDLGWASPGQFVPAFEETMNALAVGEISEPFQSEFGWHILQVQERREEDMTEQAIRSRARNVLMSRRFEDEVQLWIQEMRDESYIDIKL